MRLPEEQIKKAILHVFTVERSAVVKFGTKTTLATSVTSR